MKHGGVQVLHLIGVGLRRHPGQNLLRCLLLPTDVFLERIERETRFVLVPNEFVTLEAHTANVLYRFTGGLLLDQDLIGEIQIVELGLELQRCRDIELLHVRLKVGTKMVGPDPLLLTERTINKFVYAISRKSFDFESGRTRHLLIIKANTLNPGGLTKKSGVLPGTGVYPFRDPFWDPFWVFLGVFGDLLVT